MSAVVCPYCRAPIDEHQDELLVCASCGTPHHADCFHENGGCTVFGCTAAPPAEPKLSIGAHDLNSAPPAPAAVAVTRAAPPPPLPPLVAPTATDNITPPLFSSIGYNTGVRPRPAVQPRVAFDPHVVNPYLYAPGPDARNRTTFLVLGVLLGAFGAHSFYAGYGKKGTLQLCITLLTLGFCGFMVWIWAVIDICTITTDAKGMPFRN
jgi:TM2 domain-containing membrane protein YozV